MQRNLFIFQWLWIVGEKTLKRHIPSLWFKVSSQRLWLWIMTAGSHGEEHPYFKCCLKSYSFELPYTYQWIAISSRHSLAERLFHFFKLLYHTTAIADFKKFSLWKSDWNWQILIL